MDADYSVELPQAFVVGEGELKKLGHLLTDRIGDLAIRADCADDISRVFKTVPELLTYENPKAKEIRRIHFSATSKDFLKRATIDLSGTRWRGLSLNFHARDDVVSRLQTETLDIVAGMRPWYSVMHRVDLASISLLAYAILFLGLMAGVAFKLLPVTDSKEANPRSAAIGQLISLGLPGIFLGIGIGLNRFRDSIFPRAVFLIGQGDKRFKHLERFQWGVIIAFLVSFVAGLMVLIWQSIGR